mmetsp:Transcript_70736/g.133594  ORF Transcript_70736/g.133594 Transcript_70736/m.133594 type:complete len:877 (+) Transcript_70736:99-2729(+)
MPPAAKAKEAPRRSSAPAASPLSKYERVRELGRGSYGVVWLMRRRADRRLLAMKTVLLPPLACHEEKAIAERRQAIREAEILQMLESPHLVQYAEAILSPASTAQPQSELNILTEYCDAGDLAAHLRKIGGGRGLPERSVWGFAVAILLGLHELHHRQILHRDLKPANVFLTRADHRARSQSRGRGARGADALQAAADASTSSARVRSVGCNGIAGDFWVRVGDLGLARAMTGSHPLASTMVGSPLYCAPEIFEGTPYGEKADIYSFGVCVYELMHGRPPYGDVQNVGALVRQVLNLDGTQPRLSMDPRYSEELRRFVDACLARSAAERPTTSELLIRLPRVYAISLPSLSRDESTKGAPSSGHAADLGDAPSAEHPQTPRQKGRPQTPSPSPHARQVRSPAQNDQCARSPATHRGMTRSPSSPVAPVSTSPQAGRMRTPSPNGVQRSRSTPRLGGMRTPSPCNSRGGRLAGPSFGFQPPRRASNSVVASPASVRSDSVRTAANAVEVAEHQQERGRVEYKAPTKVDSPKRKASPAPHAAAADVLTILSPEEALRSKESTFMTPSAVEICIDSSVTLKVNIPLAAAPVLPSFGASTSTHSGNRSRAQSLNAERSRSEVSTELTCAREKSRPTSQPPIPVAAKCSLEVNANSPTRVQRRPLLSEHSSPHRDAELSPSPTARQCCRPQPGEESPSKLSFDLMAEATPVLERSPAPVESSPCSMGRTTSSNPWDAMRLLQGVADIKLAPDVKPAGDAKPAGPQQRGKAYVAKAREYWKKWRRDRQEAKAVEARGGTDLRSPGRADGRAIQKGSAREVPGRAEHTSCRQSLEVRGFAHPGSPTPVASPATPAARRGTRSSLVAARVLYTPPGRRGKGTRV